ncbi:uncharacterized protein [Argopecten irradians]|uniref:uncharacterized protein n=1 Tax=Argopecten irradians TaxID=31199 RepID=UPI00371D4C9C
MLATQYSLLLWIGFLGISVTTAFPEQYGDCIKFYEMDPIPQSSEIETICVNETVTNATFCLFYPISCPEPVACMQGPLLPTPDGKCLMCPGQECIYNGDAYAVGEPFQGLDNVNTCYCQADGRVNCSNDPLPAPDVFCGI